MSETLILVEDHMLQTPKTINVSLNEIKTLKKTKCSTRPINKHTSAGVSLV